MKLRIVISIDIDEVNVLSNETPDNVAKIEEESINALVESDGIPSVVETILQHEGVSGTTVKVVPVA